MKRKTEDKKVKRSLIPRGGNDVVYTPQYLADAIVAHYAPQMSGLVLEPCAGGGAFVRALGKKNFKVTSCEISKGKDFFKFDKKADWIMTNPPWSKARDFAIHSYELANNIVFLITINHFTGLRARRRDMAEAGFAIKEVFIVEQPEKPWPQSGFDLAAIHFQKGWSGGTTWSKMTWSSE